MHATNRCKPVCFLLALVTLFAASIALAADGERTLMLEDDVSGAKGLRLDLPAGQVLVTGGTGKTVTAVATAVCKTEKKSCNDFLAELAWDKKPGDTTELLLKPSGITSFDDVNLIVKIVVPKDKKLEVTLGAGELHIEDTSACVDAKVNAGELNLKLKESQLASAELHLKVGDVKLTNAKGKTTEGKRSLLVGASLDWNKGLGECHAKADILAGEAHLTLN